MGKARKDVEVKRTKKSNTPSLVVSEHHRAHIPARFHMSLFYSRRFRCKSFLNFYLSLAQSSTHESCLTVLPTTHPAFAETCQVVFNLQEVLRAG